MRKSLAAMVLCVFVPALAAARNLYVPAASLSPGANGSFWRTDVRVFNPSSDKSLHVTLHFLPRGLDGSNIPGQLFTVAPRGTLVLNNAVSLLWPGVVPAVGAIRIDSDGDMSYPVVAGSRTYTTSPDPSRPGTYGQFVPAIDSGEALTRSVLLLASNTPEYRTNVGAMNPGREPVTLKARLVGTDGITYLESAPKTLQPMSMEQWSIAELVGAAYFPDASFVIEASAPVFTWASVIDNLSNDAIYVGGIADDATVAPLP